MRNREAAGVEDIWLAAKNLGLKDFVARIKRLAVLPIEF